MKVQRGVSIHKQPGRPHWFCSYSIFDGASHKWKRVFRSTKTAKESEAREICRAWHKASLKAGSGAGLSADAAREIIAQGVSDVFLHANAEALDRVTIRAWCDRWLAAKEIEVSEGAHLRYKRVIERFLEFLGKKANRDLSALSTDEVLRFRDHEASERARATASLAVKVLRVCFGEAVRVELLTSNPAARVKILKSTEESKRRDFTLAEIKRILKACGEGSEWRGLVLFGLYLGQRLGRSVTADMARNRS